LSLIGHKLTVTKVGLLAGWVASDLAVRCSSRIAGLAIDVRLFSPASQRLPSRHRSLPATASC